MKKPIKITDRDIKSVLKMFTPNEVLNKFINGGARLTSKQIEDLIELRDGKKEGKNEK